MREGNGAPPSGLWAELPAFLELQEEGMEKEDPLIYWVHLPRRALRTWADVIQIAQIILSNFGDSYFFAQRTTCPYLGLFSLTPSPLIPCTQQLDSTSSST